MEAKRGKEVFSRFSAVFKKLSGKEEVYNNAHIAVRGTGKGLHILLVEDNIINRNVALKLLEKLGCHTEAVPNGSEAIKVLEQTSYDLVLMDIQMPVMDGLEATRIIRDEKSKVKIHDIPIIAMTARTMNGDREKCLLAGMNDFIRENLLILRN